MKTAFWNVKIGSSLNIGCSRLLLHSSVFLDAKCRQEQQLRRTRNRSTCDFSFFKTFFFSLSLLVL